MRKALLLALILSLAGIVACDNDSSPTEPTGDNFAFVVKVYDSEDGYHVIRPTTTVDIPGDSVEVRGDEFGYGKGILRISSNDNKPTEAYVWTRGVLGHGQFKGIVPFVKEWDDRELDYMPTLVIYISGS